jgi:hypothetical protein
MADLKIPGNSINATGTDLLDPLKQLLTEINVLGTGDATGGAFSAPSQSVAILESGATGLTKWWSTVIAALGGAAGVTAAANNFWQQQKGGTQAALVLATGAVVAAAVIALAIMVSSDVRGRAHGAVAIYEARSRIAVKFLEVSYGASAKAAAPATAGDKGQQGPAGDKGEQGPAGDKD